MFSTKEIEDAMIVRLSQVAEMRASELGAARPSLYDIELAVRPSFEIRLFGKKPDTLGPSAVSAIHAGSPDAISSDIPRMSETPEKILAGQTTTPTGTIFSSFVTLSNTIMGAGMLGLPYAFANTGWAIGILLMIAGGVTTIFSLHLLTQCAERAGKPSSFYTVSAAAMPSFTMFVDFAVLMQCLGTATSYLVISGGLMPLVMKQVGASESLQQNWVWNLIGLSIVGPLGFLRDLSILKYTSTMSNVFTFALTVLILAYACPTSHLDPCAGIATRDECVGPTVVAAPPGHVFSVAAIFILAFSCQNLIFQIVNELQEPTQRRFDIISTSAVSFSGSIFFIVSCAGYATYGNKVSSNILLSYPDNAVTSLCRVFVSILVLLCYPLYCLPGRTSMIALWSRLDKDPLSIGEGTKFIRYIVCSVFFLGSTTLVAVLCTNLGIVLSFVGATASTTVVFILPGLVYLKLFEKDPPSWKYFFARVMYYSGFVIMTLCVLFTFIYS